MVQAEAEPGVHVAHRYHGQASRVYLECLQRVARDEQSFEPCAICGHMVFVAADARRISTLMGLPVWCIECVLHHMTSDATIDQAKLKVAQEVLRDELEACPPNCRWRVKTEVNP